MDINMLQFRAYDKQEKIMFKSVGCFGKSIIIRVEDVPPGYLDTIPASDLGICNGELIEVDIGDRFDVMQCLGRKDKNDILIFAGDQLQKMEPEWFITSDPEDMRKLTELRSTPNSIVLEEPEVFADEDNSCIRVSFWGSRIDIATMDRFPMFWLENESFGYEGEDLEDCSDWKIIGNIYEPR